MLLLLEKNLLLLLLLELLSLPRDTLAFTVELHRVVVVYVLTLGLLLFPLGLGSSLITIHIISRPVRIANIDEAARVMAAILLGATASATIATPIAAPIVEEVAAAAASATVATSTTSIVARAIVAARSTTTVHLVVLIVAIVVVVVGVAVEGGLLGVEQLLGILRLFELVQTVVSGLLLEIAVIMALKSVLVLILDVLDDELS